MPGDTHTRRVLDLARQQGLLRAVDLDAIGAPRVVLTRLIAAGLLDRVGRGLYRLPNYPASEHEGLVLVAAKVPQAVFCLLTALQFHGLTTQLPHEIWIAMPRGSHAAGIEEHQRQRHSGALGQRGLQIEEHRRDGATLRVYSPAKTVVDCFKHRNKIGLDVAMEALKDAWKARKASADDLWRFAKVCRVANVMLPYMEMVAHE